MTNLVLELPTTKRLASVSPEIHSKKHVYAAEDVLRRQVLIVAQRMIAVQSAIDDPCVEGCGVSRCQALSKRVIVEPRQLSAHQPADVAMD